MDNGAEPGTWHSAHLYAMYVKGEKTAHIRTAAHSDSAYFTKAQVLQIAADLENLAAAMPDIAAGDAFAH